MTTKHHNTLSDGRIRNLAIELSLLGDKPLAYFLRSLFRQLNDDRRTAAATVAASFLVSDNGRWDKVDKWLESYIANHFEHTPLKASYVCRGVFKFPGTMMPALIVRSRRIKDKLRKRRNKKTASC